MPLLHPAETAGVGAHLLATQGALPSLPAKIRLSVVLYVLEKCRSVEVIVTEKGSITGKAAEEAASCCFSCKTGNRRDLVQL